MRSTSEPVRVARIISRLAVGGPARNVCLLTKELDPRRFRTWLICGRAEKAERQATEVAAEAGVEPIYVDQLRRGLGLCDLRASFRINQLLAAIKPQIVATHTAKAGALGRGVALLRFITKHEKVGLIHTFHGHVFNHYFNTAVSKAFIAVERQLARLTDIIITVSPTIRRQLVEEYRIAADEKVRVVPLGLEFDWLNHLPRQRGWLRATIGANDSTIVFGSVGRLTPIKNNELLLRAFARMLRQETVDARLALVGDGELREPLRALSRELGIDQRVSFCGWVLDRAKIFCDFDVTCLSSYNEGTPVCLIESLAAGVPILATRVGGVSDVALNGTDGQLVESGDEEAVAAALIKAAHQRRRVSQQRSATVRNHYSIPRLIRNIEALYDEVLEHDKPRRAVTARLDVQSG